MGNRFLLVSKATTEVGKRDALPRRFEKEEGPPCSPRSVRKGPEQVNRKNLPGAVTSAPEAVYILVREGKEGTS
jgi:hypothetical protein